MHIDIPKLEVYQSSAVSANVELSTMVQSTAAGMISWHSTMYISWHRKMPRPRRILKQIHVIKLVTLHT